MNEKKLEKEKIEQLTILIEELKQNCIEKKIAGEFAHEIRNALSGSKLLLSYLLENTEKKACLSEQNLQNLRFFKDNFDKSEQKISLVEMIQKVIENETQISKVLQLSFQSINRAVIIAEQMMRYLKYHHENIRKEKLNLTSILKHIVDMNEPVFKNQGIIFNYEIDFNDCEIFGAEIHFYSIFQNILNNARDALLTTAKKEKIISILSVISNKSISVKISDNGVGIPKKNQKMIFDSFFSMKPDTGTGIGLGIVKKLIENYKGTINVQSKKGSGTAFIISFPKGDEEKT